MAKLHFSNQKACLINQKHENCTIYYKLNENVCFFCSNSDVLFCYFIKLHFNQKIMSYQLYSYKFKKCIISYNNSARPIKCFIVQKICVFLIRLLVL